MKRLENKVLERDLLKVARRLNARTLTAALYAKEGRFTIHPFLRAWGSWNEALLACGLAITKKDKIRRVRKIDMRMRYLVLKRDRYRCVLCGRSPAKDASVELHVDHIVPFSRGGLCRIENLQTLCEQCNFGKGDD
jgi:hypothetical protein